MFDAAQEEYNAKQKCKDRRIENYYEKICKGDQEKLFYEVLFQVGNKDDMATAGENGELAKNILDKFYHSFLNAIPGSRFIQLIFTSTSFHLQPGASEDYQPVFR